MSLEIDWEKTVCRVPVSVMGRSVLKGKSGARLSKASGKAIFSSGLVESRPIGMWALFTSSFRLKTAVVQECKTILKAWDCKHHENT